MLAAILLTLAKPPPPPPPAPPLPPAAVAVILLVGAWAVLRRSAAGATPCATALPTGGGATSTPFGRAAAPRHATAFLPADVSATGAKPFLMERAKWAAPAAMKSVRRLGSAKALELVPLPAGVVPAVLKSMRRMGSAVLGLVDPEELQRRRARAEAKAAAWLGPPGWTATVVEAGGEFALSYRGGGGEVRAEPPPLLLWQRRLEELVDTEEAYGTALRQLLAGVAAATHSAASGAEWQRLAGNAADLLRLSESVLEELALRRDALRAKGVEPAFAEAGGVAHAFSHCAHFLKLYEGYASTYQDRLSALAELGRRDPKLAAEVQRGVGDLLSSVLIKPVQRLTKYNLLFTDLLKAMGAEHPNRSPIEAAQREVQKVVLAVNDMLSRVASGRTKFDVAAELDMPAGLKHAERRAASGGAPLPAGFLNDALADPAQRLHHECSPARVLLSGASLGAAATGQSSGRGSVVRSTSAGEGGEELKPARLFVLSSHVLIGRPHRNLTPLDGAIMSKLRPPIVPLLWLPLASLRVGHGGGDGAGDGSGCAITLVARGLRATCLCEDAEQARALHAALTAAKDALQQRASPSQGRVYASIV